MNAPSERLTQVGATMAALRLELDFPRTSFDREGNIVGPPKAVFNNVRLILQNDPYYAGRFSYCDFRAKLMWAPTPGGPMEAFEDHHVDHLRAELASHWRLHLPVAVAYEAARYVARGAPRHAVREYLTGLAPWDGVRRLDGWPERVWWCRVTNGGTRLTLGSGDNGGEAAFDGQLFLFQFVLQDLHK